ncbi:MAG TPA: hypothetical protein VGJ07_03490 [Rugosimonospora sp.]
MAVFPGTSGLPEEVATVAQFLAALREMRVRSDLTYRQLAAKATSRGDVLPASTVASALSRTTLPRREVVAAFVRACGLDEQTAERWLAARDRLAVEAAPTPHAPDRESAPLRVETPPVQPDQAPLPLGPGESRPAGTPDLAESAAAQPSSAQPLSAQPSSALPVSAEPLSAQPSPAQPVPALPVSAEPLPTQPSPAQPAPAQKAAGWRRRILLVTSAVLACVLLAVLVVVIHPWGTGSSPHAPGSSAGTGRPESLVDGWYLLHPAHVDSPRLCIGEGRERNGRTDRPLAVQRECPDIVPDTYLKAARANVYAIEWHSPVEGVGCLTVDEGQAVSGMLLGPTDCTGAPDQLFLFEPSDSPVPAGFRLRPVHSGLCIGLLYGPEDVHTGAELVQTTCTGAADQEFLVDRTAPKSVSP